MRNEKIIVIRCFEKQKRNSSSIYKTKGQVFNPNSQAKTSFTLTDKVIHTNTRSSVHRNQSLYNRSHRIYIYLLYITSCKGIKKREIKRKSEQTKIVVKKMYFQPNLFVLYLSVIVSKPSKTHLQKSNHFQA